MRSCPRCFSQYVTDVELCGFDGERIVETDVDPLIGKTIDRFEIIERLGHGGMSVVYHARHTVIPKHYALKMPYGEIALDPKFAERLRREAQVIAQFDHPNIVRVLDFAATSFGWCFILMELLRGRTLAQAIVEEGKLAPHAAGRVAHQIARGLSVAHQQGFVHRDLKPGNVMLTGPRGAEIAKILDFGLVHVPDAESAEDPTRSRLTETGMAVGTPVYMAPEQMRGELATPASDIYALGAVLFEMLSGRPPWIGALSDILVKQTKPAPRAPPSDGLENLVQAMLERSPAKRPSVEEVIAAIENLGLAGGMRTIDPHPTPSLRPPRAVVIPEDEPTPRFERRHRIALGVVSLLAIGGLAAWLGGDVDTASEKIKEVDRKIVTEMAEIGQRLEEKRAKSCSVRALSNRVSEVIAVIDRAQEQHRLDEDAALEKRARAIQKALAEKDVSPARCLALERSVLRIERELGRATRAARS